MELRSISCSEQREVNPALPEWAWLCLTWDAVWRVWLMVCAKAGCHASALASCRRHSAAAAAPVNSDLGGAIPVSNQPGHCDTTYFLRKAAPREKNVCRVFSPCTSPTSGVLPRATSTALSATYQQEKIVTAADLSPSPLEWHHTPSAPPPWSGTTVPQPLPLGVAPHPLSPSPLEWHPPQ